MVKGVLKRFAVRGEVKLYVTEFNRDFIFWAVKNGIILTRTNYFRDLLEAEAEFERVKNAYR